MGQKRRRIALSCVDCRRRKVKCDRTFPSCVRCQKGGYGDKCLYVTHTGPNEGSSAGLPTPEDERRGRWREESTASFQDEAQQYESTARSNDATVRRDEGAPFPTLQPRSAPPRILMSAGPASTDRRLAQLQGRLIELETMVYAAGGKPTSQEMLLGMANPMGPGVGNERNPYSDEYPAGDQDKVLLRGKAFKTQYFGPSNTLAILLQFEDLSKFVKEILLVLPSLSNAKHAISKLREKEKLAAKQPYDISIESLVGLVPDRSYSDRLIYHYLDTVETTYRIVHVPSFLKDYEAYWQSPRDARPEFIVQLLITMSITCCIAPGGEPGFVGRSSAKRELATHWINVCSYWLDCQSRKHVSLINYQLQLQIWIAKVMNCIKVKRYWTDSGALIRRFMAAGLHREPSLLCAKVNTFDCEMRRRLWYTTLELDLQTTIDRGMTPTLSSMDWDTEPPSNIDDESFDENSDKLPDSKPRGTFTRSSYLAWAAESLPLRIEMIYKVNSIRNALTYDTIINYDHKIRHVQDGIPIVGWKAAAKQEINDISIPSSPTNIRRTASTAATTRGLPNLSSPARSLIALTLAQCVVQEYLVILHQPFPTDSDFKAAHFQSRVSRRYACISNILLLNPHLSVTDTHQRCTIPPECQLSQTQRRFFAFAREDHARSALSLAHSFVIAVTPSNNPLQLHVGNDRPLINKIEAVVTMLEDRVLNLGQGFHGYWILSSALSFVHSKQSPDVPRGHFARAAADRVVKLHSQVMDGQLPRAKRMMLPVTETYTARNAERFDSASERVNDMAIRRNQDADMISSVDGVIKLKEQAAPAEVQSAMRNVYGDMVGQTTNVGIEPSLDYNAGPASMNAMGVGTDGDTFMDDMLGLDNIDWTQIMSIDPTGFMMGSWETA